MGLVAGSLLVACSDDKDPNAAKAVPALEVEAAQCLLVTDALGATVTDLPVVPCSDPLHTHEIFAKVLYTPQDLFPGMAALETFAEGECYARFEKYVLVNVFDSKYFVSWIVPSLDSWNQKVNPDYAVLCVLGDKTNTPLGKGSVKGNKQ